jgi:phospholipid/cholesterol/gamma-HCH transport system substrate-binding protein
MSSTARNTAVGLTVLVAAVVFGWMLLRFGRKSVEVFSKPQMAIHLKADRADGLAEGSAISYLGVTVGRVTSLYLDTSPSHQGVTMEAMVDTVPGIPDNVVGHVRPQSYISSGATVSLETDGPPSMTMLKPDATVPTEYVGNVLFPKEFLDAAHEAQQFIAEVSNSHLVEHLDVTVRTTTDELTKAGVAIDSIQQVVGNPKLQSDLVDAVDSIRQSADSARRITANLDAFTGKQLPQLSDHLNQTLASADTTIKTTNDSVSQITRQVDDRMEQINKLLDQTTQIAAKVNAGQGTAGALVNDPKLYDNLVESTKQLDATITDLKRLIEQWEQEGVTLKVK